MEHKPHNYYDLYLQEDCKKCEIECSGSNGEWCVHEEHPTLEKAIESTLNYKYLTNFLIHKRTAKDDDPGGLSMRFNQKGEAYRISRYGVFDDEIPQDEIGITFRNGMMTVGGISIKMIKDRIKRAKAEGAE